MYNLLFVITKFKDILNNKFLVNISKVDFYGGGRAVNRWTVLSNSRLTWNLQFYTLVPSVLELQVCMYHRYLAL